MSEGLEVDKGGNSCFMVENLVDRLSRVAEELRFGLRICSSLSIRFQIPKNSLYMTPDAHGTTDIQ